MVELLPGCCYSCRSCLSFRLSLLLTYFVVFGFVLSGKGCFVCIGVVFIFCVRDVLGFVTNLE